MLPGFWRIGSTGALPLVTAVVIAIDCTSATWIVQGNGSGRVIGDRGVPPVPGCRRNAILRPSGDQAGEESREVDAAMNRIG